MAQSGFHIQLSKEIEKALPTKFFNLSDAVMVEISNALSKMQVNTLVNSAALNVLQSVKTIILKELKEPLLVSLVLMLAWQSCEHATRAVKKKANISKVANESVTSEKKSKNPIDGMEEDEAVTYLFHQLQEEKDSCKKLYKIYMAELGRDGVWDCYEEALKAQETGADVAVTATGEKRALGGIFIKIASKKKSALNTKYRSELVAAPTQLRGYQRQCVEKILESSENCIVVAPTGSGKTAIVVEIARRMLEKKRDAKVLMLVPEVVLAEQQAAVFQKAGISSRNGTATEAFCSENQLNGNNWVPILRSHTVMVATAQSFVNVLEHPNGERRQAIDDLDLLVLDECHHTAKSHPYNIIAGIYRETAATTKVVGLTASPAADSTFEGTYKKVEELKRALRAKILQVREDDVEVLEVVARASEKEVYVKQREKDVMWVFQLEQFLALSLTSLRIWLTSNFALFTKYSDFSLLLLALDECLAPGLAHEPARRMNLLDCALRKLQELANMTEEPRELRLVVHCLEKARNAMTLVEEAGYEAAVVDLAHALHHSLSYKPPERQTMSRIGSSSSAGADAAARSSPEASTSSPRPVASKGTLFDNVLSNLLTKTPLGQPDEVVRALGGVEIVEGQSFAKLVALVKELQPFKDKPEFHGIVFVKQRQVVRYVARCLRACPALSFLDEVVEFVGHNTRAKDGTVLGKDGQSEKDKGLTGKEQVAQMSLFKKSGRRLLVSTAAAEEGIDVPSCELVVRWNAADTGIARVQSRGRGRLKDAVFVTLIVEGGIEALLHEKSVNEEKMMMEYLRKHADTEMTASDSDEEN